MNTEIISSIIAIVSILIGFGLNYLKKKKINELAMMVGSLSGDLSAIEPLKKIIQSMIVSNTLFTFCENFVEKLSDANITEPNEYITKSTDIINDLLSDALVNADILLPNAVVNKAIGIMGEDAYNNFKENCIKTVRQEYLDPVLSIIATFTSIDDEKSKLIAEISRLAIVAARVDTPVDGVLQLTEIATIK